MQKPHRLSPGFQPDDLQDPFFHFYFSFVAPRRDEVGYRPEPVLAGIEEHLRSFVGQTAYQSLALARVH